MTTVNNDDYYDRHHDNNWSSPRVIVPIVAGVALFLLALALLYSYSRRRRRYAAYPPTYPAYPVPPGTRVDPSEAPESTYVTGQHQENPDYEAGYVGEHHHHQGDGYGHSGASPGGYGSGGYGKH